MIPESVYPTIQNLWPSFEKAGRDHKIDPKLLLAISWIESAMDPRKVSPVGAQGLMQMMPATAAEVAAKLGRSTWNLLDPETALDFGAFYLSRQFQRFVAASSALAAYHAGPGLVAGNQVPPIQAVGQYTSHVMAVYRWLQEHLVEVLGRPAETVKRRGWILIAPPGRWQDPIAIPQAALPTIRALAERLHLVYHQDDVARKLYVGPPPTAVSTAPTKPTTRPSTTTPPAKGRLIVPVVGATAKDNGSYGSDSGVDVLAPVGTPVVAAAAGTIIYSEHGHTPWVATPERPHDTPNSILIALDTPFEYKRKLYPLIWYTHLSRLRLSVPDGRGTKPHVAQGEILGWTGVGNNVPHLHFGVVADRAQTEFIPPFQLAAYFGWLSGGGTR